MTLGWVTDLQSNIECAGFHRGIRGQEMTTLSFLSREKVSNFLPSILNISAPEIIVAAGVLLKTLSHSGQSYTRENAKTVILYNQSIRRYNAANWVM